MAETTNPPHPEWAVNCPVSLFETQADAIAYWRETAELEGHAAVSPLTVELVPVAEEDRDLYGADKCWQVSGEVAPKVPVGPLPVFVPGAEAVEAAGRALGKALDPSLDWDTARPHVKNYYLQAALDAINASAQWLIADAAGHVAQTASYYGAAALIGQPQLRDLSTALRKRLNDGTDQ